MVSFTYSIILESSFCLSFPETFDTFRTSSGNNLFTSRVAKFFLEQDLRNSCDISPDVSKSPLILGHSHEGIPVCFVVMTTLVVNVVLGVAGGVGVGDNC